MKEQDRHRLGVVVAFAVVYTVWSSTYLGIRLGVRDLPPALLAGVRFVIASLAIGSLARWRGQRLPRRWSDWQPALVMGFLMVAMGNGLVTWAEQWVPSNQAALIVSSSALWIAWFGTFGPRGYRLPGRVKVGLAVGFAGAVLMLTPRGDFDAENLTAKLAILFSTLCWASGTAYRRHVDISTGSLMFAAAQMFAGGMMLVGVGLANGEAARWTWTLQGMGALAYLTVFGSCIAYGTYVWLMGNTTPDKLSTVAYVTPALALLLGWIVLDETLSGLQVAGVFVLLGGVILVTLPGRRLPA
ncbi:MAG: EamA family transporter [Gammaproteobacteria bacterium]|jgi:drug/metabolite transporter (DMT)-like permease